MAVWIAITAMAVIILILAIFYLVNSVHRYGKWFTPLCLIIGSLAVGVIGGINIYNNYHSTQQQTSQSDNINQASSSSIIDNRLQTVDAGIEQDKNEQDVLTDMQKNFQKVGTVKFNNQTKTYIISPTNSQNVEAINYVLQNPAKAAESGYNDLTTGILNTSKQLQKALGSGYTVGLLKPNSDQVIYSAKDGQPKVDVVQ